MQRRGVFVALVAVAAVLVSACGYLEGLGDKTPETCDCPVLEETVASIDWAGDGREPDELKQSVGQLNRFTLRVSAEYHEEDPAGRARLLSHVIARMGTAGYEPVKERQGQSVTYEGDDWWLHVADTNVTATLLIVVGSEEPDEKTPEYLAPLVEAFGTR